MSEAKKPKIKIRKIKPKIRIIESEEKEQSVEKEQESGETPLEGIITGAPSAREFSALQSGQAPEQNRERQPATPTPASTTESEASSGARYAIQRDISEAEIRRVYQSRITGSRQASTEQQISVPEIRDSKAMFKNREIEALRTEQEDEKYSIDLEPKAASPKRKLPWEG